MSLSYADSLHLESIETNQNPSKENKDKISERTDDKNEEEDIASFSGDMNFQDLNALIYQR